MTYRLSMSVDSNIAFEVEESNFNDLLDLWEKMGGEREWVVNSVRASVARSLHGEAAGNIIRSMNGDVISDEHAEDVQDEDASSASRSRSASSANGRGERASSGQTARRSDDGPADPWASDRDEYPGEASVARDNLTRTKPRNDDPWGSGDDEPQEERQRPQGRRPRRDSNDDGGSKGNTEKDRWGNEWTVGLKDAPECDCYEPAARVKAKSKAGRWYTAWRCAKGAPGGDWQDKCEFSEFPN